MELIIFEKESYYRLMEETMSLMYKVVREALKEEQKNMTREDDFISTIEAMKLLGVKSRNRLYELRNEKIIEYYQHGRRVLYSKKSLLEYLEGQKIK
ncbi:helix-turn-helix domain-containing protein [Aquimarina aquimarini]|uniref:helix-turn-helix domain-containing protein n=1 Tax=Aquimarina aquimarini TaxID=1191734 RepID=UPI000D54E18F|nr:helix-turn-helix domain-containing protein [Aquimarina aquimarini]